MDVSLAGGNIERSMVSIQALSLAITDVLQNTLSSSFLV